MTVLNYNVLDTQAIRDILKCKAHLLRAGIPADFAAVEVLTIIIDYYRVKVGTPTYLSEMLGPLADTPIKECALYYANGERIVTPTQSIRPLQRFLRERFRSDALPFRVVCGDEERYL